MRWDHRYAFLLGLTGAAGALDALAFLHLGKVFNSFQSGNVLFVGLGVGNGNAGLVVRAGAVLVAFVAGAALGARLAGPRLSPRRTNVELRVLAPEAVLLVVFAALWILVGTPDDHPVWRVVLLVVGAAAMGIQASLSLALKVPNVVTVALTATLAAAGQRAGVSREASSHETPSLPLLVALIVTYTACAAAIATLPAVSALALSPLGLLAVGVGVDAAMTTRSPRPVRAGGAQVPGA